MSALFNTSAHVAVAALPGAALLVAGALWDQEFGLIALIVIFTTVFAATVYNKVNPNGRWWVAGLLGGVAGIFLGAAALFYIASQI